MDLARAAATIDLAARALALGGAALTGAVALTHWAVRQRYLAPFGGVSKTVRYLSDPLLRPIERRLARAGMNPQDATLWLVGLAVVLGLALVSLVRWIFELIVAGLTLVEAGPRIWAATAVSGAIGLLMLAIFVRFLAGWFGVPPTSRGMRLLAAVSDWLIIPIRRRLPPVGLMDASPLVAYLLLMVFRAAIMRLVFGL